MAKIEDWNTTGCVDLLLFLQQVFPMVELLSVFHVHASVPGFP